MFKVKICGITNRQDLEMVAKHGADYGGLIIEIEQSPRCLKLEEASRLVQNSPIPIVAVTLGKCVEDNVRITEMLPLVAIQLHGRESPEEVSYLKEQVSCEVWKVIHLPAAESGENMDLEAVLNRMWEYTAAGTDRITIDASSMVKGERQYGGTGKTVDWDMVRMIREHTDCPLILAGGIQPNNVIEAIRTVQPYGIDISSGVEVVKRKKDPEKVLSLVASVRSCETGDSVFRNNRVC